MFKNAIAEPEDILFVKKSFEECSRHNTFFHNFYERFVKRDVRIAELFKNTDLENQARALKGSLAYMLMYAEGSRIAETKIEDLGTRHDRNHLNITVDLYDHWLEALVETIKSFNPHIDKTEEKQWRHVLQIGISKIKSMY